jgi:hypothetical protein
LDEFSHGLVRDAAAFGQGRESSAVAIDVLEYAQVSAGDVVVAGGVEAGDEVVDHRVRGLPDHG